VVKEKSEGRTEKGCSTSPGPSEANVARLGQDSVTGQLELRHWSPNVWTILLDIYSMITEKKLRSTP
jgi:hypothetical protein